MSVGKNVRLGTKLVNENGKGSKVYQFPFVICLFYYVVVPDIEKKYRYRQNSSIEVFLTVKMR